MFGYLKYYSRFPHSSNKKTYKYYYCSLCNSLKKNYGLLSTLFLSNDVTYLSILLLSNKTQNDCACPRCSLYTCSKRIPQVFSNHEWRGFAAFSMGLVYAKAIDDSLDNSSFWSSIKRKLIFLAVRKARKENPALFDYLKSSIYDIKKLEEKDCGIISQGARFANMITDALRLCLPNNVDDASMKIVFSTMKWLCFIDAVDDFNKDKKNKCYNPLCFSVKKPNDSVLNENIDWNRFFSNNWKELNDLYGSIYRELLSSLAAIKNTNEKDLIYQMNYSVMPKNLLTVMRKNSSL